MCKNRKSKQFCKTGNSNIKETSNCEFDVCFIQTLQILDEGTVRFTVLRILGLQSGEFSKGSYLDDDISYWMESKAPESHKSLRASSKCVLTKQIVVKPCSWHVQPENPIRKDRDRDLEKFTKGECWLMFATDVTRHQCLRHTHMGCRAFVESHYFGFRKFSAKCATHRSLICKTCRYMQCLHIVYTLSVGHILTMRCSPRTVFISRCNWLKAYSVIFSRGCADLSIQKVVKPQILFKASVNSGLANCFSLDVFDPSFWRNQVGHHCQPSKDQSSTEFFSYLRCQLNMENQLIAGILLPDSLASGTR